jgi:hypothetical protein
LSDGGDKSLAVHGALRFGKRDFETRGKSGAD